MANNKSKRLTNLEKQQIRELFKMGLSTRQLAEYYEVSMTTIQYHTHFLIRYDTPQILQILQHYNPALQSPITKEIDTPVATIVATVVE